jgi:hypothetical protein
MVEDDASPEARIGRGRRASHPFSVALLTKIGKSEQIFVIGLLKSLNVTAQGNKIYAKFMAELSSQLLPRITACKRWAALGGISDRACCLVVR